MDKRIEPISEKIFVALVSYLDHWTPQGEPTDWEAMAQTAMTAAKALTKEWDREVFGEGGDPSYYFPTNDFVLTQEDFEDDNDEPT